MPAPDLSHPALFLDYAPLDTQSSVAESKIASEIPRTPAPSAGMVDIIFKDPLKGSTW